MNNNLEPTMILCRKIAEFRRAAGITQTELSNELGVTFQAVSKWETFGSCPDISMLPKLAEIFGVSIDELFGMEKEEKNANIPWEDDGKIRVAVFEGTRKVSANEYRNAKKLIRVQIEGKVKDVISECDIVCNEIYGDVSISLNGANNTEMNLACENIRGDVVIGVKNCGNIPVTIACEEIGADVTVSSNREVTIACDEVGGNVVLSCEGGSVTCDNVGGDIVISGENSVVTTENIVGSVVISEKAKLRYECIEGEIVTNKF